jgi:hypothetical protein
MKKGAIIALIALATSVAVYAGNGKKKSKHKAKTECCDKTKCCPAGTSTCK